MNWTPEYRLRWLIRLISAGLIAGMVLSWKAWISDRLYPLFPVWDWVPQFPAPLDILFVLLFFGVLGWMLVKPARSHVILVLIMILIFAVQDQSRWQPWFYQYALMLTPFIFLKVRGDQKIKQSRPRNTEVSLKKSGIARTRLPYPKNEESNAALGIQQLIIVMVYMWGGIHKCSGGFLEVYETSLIAPILDGLESPVLRSALVASGYLIPPIEILTGLGLIFKPTRNSAIAAALITHVTILILLGPVKETISNSVVWPWNLVMMGMVIVLFYRVDRVALFAFCKARLLIPGIAIGSLMIVTPVLLYFNLWDRYLSFSLYAGQQKRFLVRVDASAVDRVPAEMRNYLLDTKAADGHKILSPSRWSNEELNVPLVSEWRILRAFSRHLCQSELGATGLLFFVDYSHFPDKPKQFFRCDQIDEMRER